MDSDTATLFRLAALNSDYAACIDADRLEEFPYFFLEDCVYKITTADNHRRGYAAGVIYADSRAMLLDRVAALREANIYERHAYRHIIGMPRVTAEAAGTTSNARTAEAAGTTSTARTAGSTGATSTAGTVIAETPFVVIRTMRDGGMDIFAAGRYLDRVAADSGGTLRFAERIVVCDSPRFDTLLAIPL